jgi:hypothetical protein
MDAAEVLEKAAVEVGKGWTDEGQYADCHGNVCAYGAIARVMYGDAKYFTNHSVLGLEAAVEDPELVKVTSALRKVMAEQFAACLPDDHTNWDSYGLITEVNDNFAEQKDVVACMEKAAAGLREQI